MLHFSNSFILTLLTIVLLFILGAWKGVDVSIPLVSVTSAYVCGRAGMKVGMVYSASKDPNCSTSESIDKLKD